MTKMGARLGHIVSQETRKKISDANKGRKFSEEHKKRLSVLHKGKILSEETRRKMSESRKGRIVSELTREKLRQHRHSEATKIRIGEAHKMENLSEDTLKRKSISATKALLELWKNPDYRKKMSEAHIGKMKGENHPSWTGTTPIYSQIRSSAQYKQWRISIFRRDDFTCVWCGIRGGNLEADHIKPFAYYTELRFNLDNGRTLCRECHKRTDTYANKAKKLWQLNPTTVS